MADYDATYERSITDPRGFWGEAAALIDWIKAPTEVLDESRKPFYRWYPDGTLNTCYNALDRHVIAGYGDRTALIYDSAVTGAKRKISYAELLDHVAAFGGVLRDLGVDKGDRVVIYMPMIPEAVVAMLACARIGAVHSVVFGGFAPNELAIRIDDATPKVIVTASCGIEPGRTIAYKPFVDAAIELSEHKPAAVVLKQRPEVTADLIPGRDHDWDDVIQAATPADCVEVAATDPLYILYTSGTTGKPKGIVRDNGGHAVAMAWSLPNIYGCQAGDVWWAASDVGWVVGHSYIVYSPLINGATSVIFEGKPVGTPDAGTFWRVIHDYGVKALFTAPTAIRAIKKDDPNGTLLQGTETLETLFLAGERLDPDTWEWATAMLGVPVVDNWWQTETGWPIAANLRGMTRNGSPLPIKPGSPSVAVPGYRIEILDDQGAQVGPDVEGAICLKLPMPPGTLPTLWGDDGRYVSSYLSVYDGYYLSGDGGFVDADGYVYVMGRTDDVINVAGHRLSTGSMEAVISTHHDVAECAVIGVADSLKGQMPRGFIVLKSGVETDPEQIRRDLVRMVREQIGAVASFKEVEIVGGLPKTRSGKILRKTMREIADGGDPTVPSTIEDAGVLDKLRPVLRKD